MHCMTCILLLRMIYFDSQRPEAPQGSTSPLEDTGSPISSAVTMPSYFFITVPSMLSQHCRLKACRIGVDQEKQWIIRKNLSTQLNKWMNGILDLPNLTFWSASVRRRIHNDSIVTDCRDGFLVLQNFTQSSTSQRIGLSDNPDDAAFSFAQATIPLEAST